MQHCERGSYSGRYVVPRGRLADRLAAGLAVGKTIKLPTTIFTSFSEALLSTSLDRYVVPRGRL